LSKCRAVLDGVEDHTRLTGASGRNQVGFNGKAKSDVDGCVLLLTAEPLLAVKDGRRRPGAELYAMPVWLATG
jgi:hypothetical protein